MRGTEGTLRDEAGVAGQLACHGVYLGGLQALGQRQGRQNAGQSLGQHRLAAARRPDHDEVVATGSSHLKGALHAFLSAHIAEVKVVVVLLFEELAAGVDDGGLIRGVAIQELDDIHQRVHAIDFQLVHHSRFTDVLLWHEESLEMLFARTDGNGQRTAYGLQMAVETQLAHQHVLPQAFFRHVATGCQNT